MPKSTSVSWTACSKVEFDLQEMPGSSIFKKGQFCPKGRSLFCYWEVSPIFFEGIFHCLALQMICLVISWLTHPSNVLTRLYVRQGPQVRAYPEANQGHAWILPHAGAPSGNVLDLGPYPTQKIVLGYRSTVAALTNVY